MVLFPVYAMLVWAVTWRWRRSWIGLGAVVAGVLGVGLLGIVHRFTAVVFPAHLEGPLFSLMLVVEALCVLVVGLFITTLPRERVDRPCRRCRYELVGLEEENPTCPECGMAHAARRVKLRHCRVCAHALWLGRGDNPACPVCGVDHCICEIKPEGPGVLAPVFAAAARVIQPLTSRYIMPRARTHSGRPTIMVVRNPDNTFTSIG